ncbi:MAG: hydrogenobyrinic acid a,c-diamide synthase (glutamine-hydrolyzing) [candidate division Zixibacteria bacterium]|nr:hydrogenobyrinic acid a,c-diamide synthase (glutamine-hydrolyzing) [candidate division Zixibacteria bacterium]
MSIKIPRLLVAGLSGDSGKTIASLSLLTALKQRGRSVAVFKKGPDYIDAAWLSRFAKTDCRNLDTYMVSPNTVFDTFVNTAAGVDFALIEGNRGIFDGKDKEGTHSTAELAKLLCAPVILVVSASKATRTLAAVIKGCLDFDPQVNISGVILNKVAGRRHETIITEAVRKYCNLPVLGVIPRIEQVSTLLPGRHLGLVTPFESENETVLRQQLAQIARDYLDVEALLELADKAQELDRRQMPERFSITPMVKVGYFCDPVFTFYYPENLEALKRNGAELIPISSLEDGNLPDINALYIGGGFPETHAEKLVCNSSLMTSVKKAIEGGLPVYAECGGLIYLSRSLTWHDKRFPMAGVFPVDLTMESKPVGHGYTLLQVDRSNPYFEPGLILKGHEFHYSAVIGSFDMAATCLAVRTGFGLGSQRDGMLYKNCLGCYTHIHADSVSGWAKAIIEQAKNYQTIKFSDLGKMKEAGIPNYLKLLKRRRFSEAAG